MKKLLVKIKQLSPQLYYCALIHAGLFVVFIVLCQIDHRQLLGVDLWEKPAKFAISIAIYCLTWPLLLQFLPFDKVKKGFALFTVFVMLFEMAAVSSQAARGQMSHFNIHGLYNIIVFSLMGIFIVLQTFFSLYIGILFFKIKAPNMSPSLLWSIRLGIIIGSIFALEGGLMGARLSHTVGAADGTPGLSILNWSKVAGDLRISHFLGLHALQIVPLFAVYIGRDRKQLTIAFAAFYFLAVTALFYNAMLGRPLF